MHGATARVSELLAEAEKVDAKEDAEFGVGRRGDELPEELQRAETRLKRIREAKKALEAERAPRPSRVSLRDSGFLLRA